MSENLIETHRISKYFKVKKDYFCAVKDVSLEIPKGEITCILGPSGDGKSTLLKMLGGIFGPSEGSITFDGETYEDVLPVEIRQKIGIVFQTDNLLPWRSVRKNLKLSLELLKKPQEWDAKIDEKLELVGLKAYADALPHELSGGMRQRVGIARALVHDPELLLMDQPFNALDAITKRIISYSFLDIWRDTGKTVVFITNDIDEALLFGKRIYLLSSSPATVAHVIDASSLPMEERREGVETHAEFQRLKSVIRPMLMEAAGWQKEEQ